MEDALVSPVEAPTPKLNWWVFAPVTFLEACLLHAFDTPPADLPLWLAGAAGMAVVIAGIGWGAGALFKVRATWFCLLVSTFVFFLMALGSASETKHEPAVVQQATSVYAGQPEKGTDAQEVAQWSAASGAFIADHPGLRIGKNMALFQDYLNHMWHPGMSNHDLLMLAYIPTTMDNRWQEPPTP